MNNVIYFNDILKKAYLRRNQMADALDMLEKMGYLSEEYIAYSLKFMTNEQLKQILSSIKFTLREDLNNCK